MRWILLSLFDAHNSTSLIRLSVFVHKQKTHLTLNVCQTVATQSDEILNKWILELAVSRL